MAVAAHAAPRYRQVAAELERAIESAACGRTTGWHRSGRSPSGTVSRMTARQAVESLVRRGTVIATGSGTFVSPPRVVHTLQRLAGFSERMRAQGIEPSGHVLEMRRTRRVDVQARAALELGPGGRAWMVRRVRFGDREPLLLETFWVPDALCPRPGPARARPGIAVRPDAPAVRDRPVHRGRVDRAGLVLEPADARHLGARPGAPAMVVTRTARDREGRPVEFARDVYRGDRARFEVALHA